MNWIFGGRRGGVIPGSMPNPAVKPSIADGTAEAIRGRAGRRRKSCLKEELPPRNGRLLYYIPSAVSPRHRDCGPCRHPDDRICCHPDDRREEGSYSARPQPWIPSSLRSSPRLNYRLPDDYEGSRVCRRQPHRRKGDSRRGDVRNVVRSGGVAHWESEDLGSQNV